VLTIDLGTPISPPLDREICRIGSKKLLFLQKNSLHRPVHGTWLSSLKTKQLHRSSLQIKSFALVPVILHILYQIEAAAAVPGSLDGCFMSITMRKQLGNVLDGLSVSINSSNTTTTKQSILMTQSIQPFPQTTMLPPSSKQPAKRVVRFMLRKDKHQQLLLSCPILLRQRRRRMMIRRHIQKSHNAKLGITKNEQWFSSSELKALQIQCARDVQTMEQSFYTSSSSSHPHCNVVHKDGNDVDNDTLSLSRFLTSRREKRSLVQRQLLGTIRAIQEYQAATQTMMGLKERDDFCCNLMANQCGKYTQNMVDLAHVEGLYCHLQVMLQQQKGDL
jgi:hypothetical protein